MKTAMSDVGFFIDLGPSSGANVRFGLDSRNPERLLILQGGAGCLRLVGLAMLIGGLVLQANGLARSARRPV